MKIPGFDSGRDFLCFLAFLGAAMAGFVSAPWGLSIGLAGCLLSMCSAFERWDNLGEHRPSRAVFIVANIMHDFGFCAAAYLAGMGLGWVWRAAA